ncbi:MAG: hypothetical protein AAB152_12250 [Candidatus Coatesbacteria bacterium]
MDKPVASFRAGLMQAAVFVNTRKTKNGEVKIPSASFSKRYLEDGEWKSTTTLDKNDIPKAILVLTKAYDYITTTYHADRSEEPEESDAEAA